jgi:hypothetical protein
MKPQIAPATQAVQAGVLLRRLRERLATVPGLSTCAPDPAGRGAAARTARPVRTRTILGADVAAEFGKPGQRSSVATLVAATDEVIDGRLHIVAPAAIPAGSTLPLAVLVIAGADSIAGVDCYGLRNAALRIDGLDGVSVRAMPGRLWVRLNREALAAGTAPRDFAAAIHAACRRVRGVTGVEVVIACDDVAGALIEPLVAVGAAQTGEHVRLKWNQFGDLECSSMDCRSCEEAPVCDQLRQVVRIRTKRRKNAHV